MEKQFTTIVPDKLYFPEVTGNNTATFTYSGPASISVNITNPSIPYYVKEEDYRDDDDVIVTVDADSDTKAAYLLLPNPITSDQFTFQEETLLDGTKYLNRLNPSLHDYYQISYNPTTKEFEYTVKYRDWKTANLKRAELILTTIQTGFLERIVIDDGGNDAVKDFIVSSGVDVGSMNSDQVVDVINTFVSVLQNYIEQEKEIITWKYVEPYTNELPEIPQILQKFF